MRLVLLVVVILGCSSSSPATEPFAIDNLSFRVPSGWASRNLSTPTRTMFEWTPADNDGKESLSVLRVNMREAFASGGIERLERLLSEAQRVLPHGRFAAVDRFVTNGGLAGVRVEGEFQPPEQNRRYRRMHAVVQDRTTLVHVIYTALEAERDSFDALVGSLTRKGA